MDEGFINSITDLYKLEQYKSRMIKMDGFGIKSYTNLMSAIEKSKTVKFESFVYSLGIDQIGKGGAKRLAKHFKNDINAFLAATSSHHNFTGITDFGLITAYAVYEYFEKPENMAMVNELLQYVTVLQDKPKEIAEIGYKDLSGVAFVVTGDVKTFKNRKELEDLILSLNGKLNGSVSSKTNYLINNDVTSTSGKNQKAKEVGVPIISEAQFNEIIGRNI